MANTEGMTDEFVESLATAGSTMSSFSSAQRLKQKRLQERRQRGRLQERMDLPMGGSPSAKIIRASPNNHTKRMVNEPGSVDEASPPSPSEMTQVTNSLPLIGDIVEHKQNRNRHRSNRNTAKASRFSSRNQKSNSSVNAANNDHNSFHHKHVTGFPSVHDLPLGTFVKHKNKKVQKTSRPAATMATRVVSKDTSTSSHDVMKKASSLDSRAMLAGMSLEEIKDHKSEIEQSLSPDLVAFLRKRRQQKTPETNEQQTVPNTAMITSNGKKTYVTPTEANKADVVESIPNSIADNITNESNINHEKIKEEEVERKEKERMAKLVASIRTHEDLDATYRIEMKGHVFNIDFEKNGDADSGKKIKEEFMVACDLLRSSSPRQTLWAARTVSLMLDRLVRTTDEQGQYEGEEEKKLELSTESKNQAITIDELPTTLSVSLRCLLDKPLNSSFNYLLHTYVLQSLYYLTMIYAHSDHDVIYGSSSQRARSGISIFQEDFMDDAVPSPSLDTAYSPISVRPLAVDETASPNDTESSATNSVAAYMTSSSTSSAISDGEDFKKDPMWTLLSKMKITPRLAFLLEPQQHMVGIPTKAFISACGIISMVGQRSPGAASAIVRHKTLTSSLLRRMLEQIQLERSEAVTETKNEISIDSDDIAFSTIRLFCIMSRQSRVVAASLPLEDILPPLLATGLASSYQQFRVQQHALFLWRTMLRYGLGLEALASMLTISARHFALPYFHKFSLSSDFLSSFTLVLETVKVTWRKNGDMRPDIQSGGESKEELISQVTRTVVGTATKMMMSTLQAVLPKTLSPPNHLEFDDRDTEKNLTLRYRWNASRLLYLSAWFQLFDPAIKTKSYKSIEDCISFDDQKMLLLTLREWAEPNGDVEKAWLMVPKWCDSTLEIQKLQQENETLIKIEASACAFINAYFTMSLVFLRSKSPNRHIEDIKKSFHRKIVERIIVGLMSAVETAAIQRSSNSDGAKSSSSLHSARVRWINQCQFAVAKFCFHSISIGQIGRSSEICLVQSLVFSLIGRLHKGDESIAAVLFSNDVLFQTSDNKVQNGDVSTSASLSSSPISSMFLGEICGSEDARKQLDHSFKLQHGSGITAAGFGPFQLDSLLSGAEIPISDPSAAKDNPSNKSFPLGRLWLWQSLSGSIRVGDDAVASGTKEASDVIASVLELILNLNETGGIDENAGYVGQLPMGSKLYYLMNVCLHHEEILRDERVLKSGETLLDQYLQSFGYDNNDITDFCQECLNHSGCLSANKVENDDEDDDALNGMDKELLDQFSNALTIDLKDSKISSEQIRAMIAFLEDLAAAYRDYGAQYDFFTKCIRVFLLPMFPSLIRCRALRELEKMLHLLTVSKELKDEVEMTNLVSKSLTGGLPLVDNSIRDDTDVLNAVAKAMAASSPRPLEGYMRHYCIGMLVRNFAMSLSTKQGVESSKKRLERLNIMIVRSVCKATETFLQSREGTKNALVKAVINSLPCDCADDSNGIGEEQNAVQYLDACIALNSSYVV